MQILRRIYNTCSNLLEEVEKLILPYQFLTEMIQTNSCIIREGVEKYIAMFLSHLTFTKISFQKENINDLEEFLYFTLSNEL